IGLISRGRCSWLTALPYLLLVVGGAILAWWLAGPRWGLLVGACVALPVALLLFRRRWLRLHPEMREDPFFPMGARPAISAVAVLGDVALLAVGALVGFWLGGGVALGTPAYCPAKFAWFGTIGRRVVGSGFSSSPPAVLLRAWGEGAYYG